MKVRSRFFSTPTRRSSRSFKQRNEAGWTSRRCIDELRRLGTRKNVDGMARFGIRAKIVYGVSKPKMDVLAKRVGKNHDLALQLWASGVHDARILAGMIDEAGLVTAA